MENLSSALGQLRLERRKAQSQLQRLDAAIAAIEGLLGRNHSAISRNGVRSIVSGAARRRMAQAQRARWARVRQAKGSTPQTAAATPKRVLSGAVRRKIAAAQRARWARIRAKQAKKPA